MEQYTLRVGQEVLARGGMPFGILDVEIEYLRKHEKPTTEEGRENGHGYQVLVSSNLGGFLSEEMTWTTGSTALEAMTKAMKKLEDDLRPSVPPKKRQLARRHD